MNNLTLKKNTIPVFVLLLSCAMVVLFCLLITTGGANNFIFLTLAIFAILILFTPTWVAFNVYLVYLAFGGLFKNLTLYHPLLHVAVDILMVLLLLNWATNKKVNKKHLLNNKFSWVLGAFIVWCVIEIFAPITNPILALGGFKSYVLPIAMFYLSATLLDTSERFKTTGNIIIVLGCITAAGAILQVIIGAETLATIHPGLAYGITKLQSTFTGDGLFRAYSISETGGSAAFMEGLSLLVLVVRITKKNSNWVLSGITLIIYTGASLLLVSGILISGVRSVLLALFAGLFIFIIFYNVRLIFLFLLAFFIVINGANFVSSITEGKTATRLQTLSNPFDAYVQNRGTTWSNIPSLIINNPLGTGMGKGAPGANVLANFANISLDGAGGDNMFLSMLAETGDLGAILFFSMCVISYIVGFKLLQSTETSEQRDSIILSLALMSMILATFLSGSVLFAQPGSFYFWLAGGVIFAQKKRKQYYES